METEVDNIATIQDAKAFKTRERERNALFGTATSYSGARRISSHGRRRRRDRGFGIDLLEWWIVYRHPASDNVRAFA